MALGAVGVAALLAAFAPGGSVVPLLYALPVLVAALVLVAPEAALVALVALVLFSVAIGLNDDAGFFPAILSLVALCVVALVLSSRHRDEQRRGRARRRRAPATSPPRPHCSGSSPPTWSRRSTCRRCSTRRLGS